jgi:hypothetical protein
MIDKELFRSSTKLKAVKMIDQNYLNNGGHDEFIIFKFGGYKSMDAKYCLVEHDIYGKAKSSILSKEEVIKEFGEEAIKNL